MKKLFAPLVLLMALMVGSLGQAQRDGFGIYTGTFEVIGVQTQTSNLRLGVALADIFISYIGISGSADLILGTSPLLRDPTGALSLDWYYGAGATAAVYVGGGVGFSLYPHALAGLTFDLKGLEQYPFYVELQGGAKIGLGGFANSIPYFAGRAGVIFR